MFQVGDIVVCIDSYCPRGCNLTLGKEYKVRYDSGSGGGMGYIQIKNDKGEIGCYRHNRFRLLQPSLTPEPSPKKLIKTIKVYDDGSVEIV